MSFDRVSWSSNMGIDTSAYSLIVLGIIAAVGIVGLAVFLWRRFGPAISLLVLITALVVLPCIAVAVSWWLNDAAGSMMV